VRLFIVYQDKNIKYFNISKKEVKIINANLTIVKDENPESPVNITHSLSKQTKKFFSKFLIVLIKFKKDKKKLKCVLHN